MDDLDALLTRLEELVGQVEEFADPVRETVVELLDGLDSLHRGALTRLGEALDAQTLDRLRDTEPAIAWLFHVYGVGIGDPRVAAEAALEIVRPSIEEHGGTMEVLDVRDGRVRLRLAGNCAGCTASAVTLREGVERALQENFPGFAGLEVEEESAPAHPPPGPTLLQIEPYSPGRR